MGKQILFYMDTCDEVDFLRYLRATGDVVIVPQASTTQQLELFQDFQELEGRLLGESCHLWNRSISSPPVITHVTQQGYYWLDFLQSEVVNVLRSKKTGDGLSMGRLHIEDKSYVIPGQTSPKGPAFSAWFSGLCRWIRDHSVAVIDKAYVQPMAHALIQAGVPAIGHRF